MYLGLRWTILAQTRDHPHNHSGQDDQADKNDQIGGEESKDELVRMIELKRSPTQIDSHKQEEDGQHRAGSA